MLPLSCYKMIQILAWPQSPHISFFILLLYLPAVEKPPFKRSPNSRRDTCPFNSNHPGAAPYSSKYPYTGLKNGLTGTGVGDIKVPADGDTAHQFEAPGPNDI